MYRMSIITMLCPPSLSAKLDIAKCTKMALIHDMAESLVGDITPVDGVTKAEKSRREAETMDYLCSGLLGNVDGGEQGKHIREVWQEYEDAVTTESHFVHGMFNSVIGCCWLLTLNILKTSTKSSSFSKC
jgi:putative hydrolases of HD superfamily